MRDRLRLLVLLALAVAAAAALRPALARALASIRRYSAPGAAVYDALFGRLLAPLHARVVDEVVALAPAGTVLEVGPGPGRLAVMLARRAPNLSVLGVDVDPAMVELARRRAAAAGVADRVRFEEGDVAALPLGDGTVDVVVSTFSLHHWRDPVRGLDEVHRVLRAGGRAVIVDLHPLWTRLETRGPGPAEAASASAFGSRRLEEVRWPAGLPGVVHVTLHRPGPEAGPS